MIYTSPQTLRCVELKKSFGPISALDINGVLEFSPGNIYAIIGPNGAGKSTLVNVATGFLEADSGQCLLGNVNLCTLPPHKIARLGVARTFQELRLVQQVPVLENILLGLGASSSCFSSLQLTRTLCLKAQATKILESVGLIDETYNLAGELSYGQQKLLSLACCIATNPFLFIFDEPVAGIHLNMIDKILSIIREIKKRGGLVIFIEHNLEAVRSVADVVVAMDQGKVISAGSPEDVLNRSEVTEAYLG